MHNSSRVSSCVSREKRELRSLSREAEMQNVGSKARRKTHFASLLRIYAYTRTFPKNISCAPRHRCAPPQIIFIFIYIYIYIYIYVYIYIYIYIYIYLYIYIDTKIKYICTTKSSHEVCAPVRFRN